MELVTNEPIEPPFTVGEPYDGCEGRMGWNVQDDIGVIAECQDEQTARAIASALTAIRDLDNGLRGDFENLYVRHDKDGIECLARADVLAHANKYREVKT